MEINEALRRIVRGHWRLLVTCLLLPVVLVGALGSRSHPGYFASARIQASGNALGSDTEADSVLNRVKGVATSPAVVEQALASAQITDRAASDVAQHEVTLTRLGSSAVIDITVTDRNPAVASDLAGALAGNVVEFLGGTGSQQPRSLISQLTAQQQTLLGQREKLVAELGKTQDRVQSANLSAQLSTFDQELTDLAATIRALQVTVATTSSATVISPGSPARHVPTNVSTNAVLALLGGLVLGLLLASLIEVLRPRLADARAFGRELGVPMLGMLAPAKATQARQESRGRLRLRRRGPPGYPTDKPAASHETVVATRQAADRATASTLVLTGDREPQRLAEVASCLTVLLADPLRVAAYADGSSAPNGRAASSRIARNGPAVSVGGGSNRIANRVRTLALEAQPKPAEWPLRVLPLSEVERSTPVGGYALLLVVSQMPSYAELRRVDDLALATGWPVIGVLGDPNGRVKRS